ncbi:hypothetical protein EON65_42745 [archaeon]|nr:MAG: hypothetical protein EON65_42745 [archaeon]
MSLNLDEVKKFIYETVFRNTDLRGGKEEIQTLPLWKTCIQHAVYTPYRKSFVLALGRQIEQEEASEGGGDVHKLQHFQRLVIFEAVVATGRVEILRNLILEQNTDGFVLADIQRIYDWIVGSKDSLVKSLEAAIIQILSSDILPYILRQQPYDQLSAANHINELKSFLHSVQILTQALFERKLHSLLDRFGSIERAVAFEKILNDTLLSQSVVELFFLHEEWCMLKTLWNVVSLVATHTSVGFVDINILRQEYHVWSEKRGADADLLPLFISECSLIFKDLLAALPGTLRYDICTRTNNSPVEILFEILFLPYRRLLAYKEEVMSSKVYVGRTLDDLTDQLVSHVQSARVVSLYYLLSSYYAQNISSEAMKPALSEAYGCSVNEVELVGILVDIDREVDKDGLAVQAVCQEDNMSYIKQSGWKVLPIIIKRLLVLGQQQHVQAMMVQLGACNHEYLHTPEGVVAYATSVTVPQWEVRIRGQLVCTPSHYCVSPSSIDDMGSCSHHVR